MKKSNILPIVKPNCDDYSFYNVFLWHDNWKEILTAFLEDIMSYYLKEREVSIKSLDIEDRYDIGRPNELKPFNVVIETSERIIRVLIWAIDIDYLLRRATVYNSTAMSNMYDDLIMLKRPYKYDNPKKYGITERESANITVVTLLITADQVFGSSGDRYYSYMEFCDRLTEESLTDTYRIYTLPLRNTPDEPDDELGDTIWPWARLLKSESIDDIVRLGEQYPRLSVAAKKIESLLKGNEE